MKMEPGKPLKPENYKELSNNLKTISYDVFNTIFHKFYPSYQKHLNDNNLYDDLDLVWGVLDRMLLIKNTLLYL